MKSRASVADTQSTFAKGETPISKGSANAAKNQVGIDQAFANSYNTSGTQDRSQLFPFLQSEITNPTGFGQPAVQDMLTQGGEAVSGATGAADEKASLLASRTGNAAALPGAIASNARSAMGQNSDNALSVAIQNAKLKQTQQQQGAAGLGGLYGEDTNSVLKSLGLTDDSINAWTGGKAAANKTIWDPINAAIEGGSKVGAAAV